jgi:hypothetical protein
MRREALTLVFSMIAGTVLMAACEKKPPEPKTADATSVPVTGPAPASPAAVPSPPPPVVASSSENKDGQPPVQGQVDPKHPPQQKDFQQTR